MEKPKQPHNNYKGVSANEYYTLSLIEKIGLVVFGVEEVMHLSNWNKSRVYNTLFSLEKKGLIKRIKRNSYAIAKDLNENLFKISTEVIKPSYISFWSALSFYGFTEQQLKTVQLVSTKQTGKVNIDSFRIEITAFQPKRFYGYKKMEGFVIAEPEKVLVDSLYRLDKCGGLNEFAKCLRNSWKHLNKKRFVDYLVRFNNKSVISRAGFLIENLNLEVKQIERLQRHKSKSFVNLNPKKGKSREYNKKWNVIVDHKIRVEEII